MLVESYCIYEDSLQSVLFSHTHCLRSRHGGRHGDWRHRCHRRTSARLSKDLTAKRAISIGTTGRQANPKGLTAQMRQGQSGPRYGNDCCLEIVASSDTRTSNFHTHIVLLISIATHSGAIAQVDDIVVRDLRRRGIDLRTSDRRRRTQGKGRTDIEKQAAQVSRRVRIRFCHSKLNASGQLRNRNGHIDGKAAAVRWISKRLTNGESTRIG
jgi:hypothetical protein